MYELYHHGILGQKWGRMNGPPYPLDSSNHSAAEKKAGWRKSLSENKNSSKGLTNTTKKKYNVDIEKAEQNVSDSEELKKQALEKYYKSRNQSSTKELQSANKKAQWAKEDLKSEKIKQKLNDEKSKSNRRVKLEKYYQDKGMNEEEAAVAAYKREKTEKILKVTAGVAVTAAAAYVAYKHYDATVDKWIDSDSVLSRIDTDGSKSVHDAFYAAVNKSDKTKYLGMYGDSLQNSGKTVYQKTIQISKSGGLKVASEKNATKILSDLVNNDPSYAKSLSSQLQNYEAKMNVFNSTPKQQKAVNEARKALSKGVVNSKVYDGLNYTLMDHSSNATTKFYDELRKNGYSAIRDVNDKKLSGYMSKNPLIVFDSSKVTVNSVRNVKKEEIAKAKIIGYMDISVKQIVPQLAGTTAAGLVVGATTKYSKTKSNDKIVAEYKKEHPNTTLSYNEIVRNNT